MAEQENPLEWQRKPAATEGHYFRLRPWWDSREKAASEHVLDFELWEECSHDDRRLLTGFLKWDGCSNWATDPACMYHFCGPENADELAADFRKLYADYGKLIPAWDGE